jgi:hypothetical protein
MTYASALCYWLTCDHPEGCNAKSSDTGDYGGSWDTTTAEEDAEDEGWFVDREKFKHFCRLHHPEPKR